ncbi:hypothetical protein FI667_g3982, partial [Globisporangium splendens]
MSHRLSQNARHTNDLLEELERDKELEVLREYLTRFDLFPRQRDPAVVPIRFEELKELVKHWKLHRQRNFWKTHATKEDLVRTLYRHINTKIIPQENREESNSNASAVESSRWRRQLPTTCSELMQSNTPAVLARLSMSSHDKVKELCANALFNLSCEKSLHSFLLKDDIFKAITRLCKKFVVNKDGDEVEDETPVSASDKTPVVLLRSQECAIGCLFNLAFFEESREVLIRVDVVEILFHIFQRPVKNEELVKQCAGIIANLSFDADSRVRMVDDGCVRLIRKLTNSSNKDTLLCCSTASCNLAAEALEKTPILSMLIDLSASPYANITLTCAIAFSKLASNASFRPTLTKCPELYPALTLMMRCGIEDIQIYSAVTLCNLAVERSQRSRHIWKEGTVPDFIVNSLLRINSDSTKEICARALYNLLTHDEYRLAHIKEGVLYALVKLA